MPRMTSQEYAQWLARTGERVIEVEREEELHEQILAECGRRGWIALHGSMGHRTHRTVGEPDFIILGEYGEFLMIECKRPGSKCSQEQNAFHAWAAKLGHTVHVVTSYKEFMEAAYGNIR